ncbi:Na+/H+ antiporter [Scheffersomyces stipitis CBS 6054]|uniref:Na+/H+ antiporter n=1 Tax=Scheffersomyces stipitis (strain ATCC 58785 / CBS 6054 / NBRC 10063 / NRRL Y-11545) TaxID=322104 RepID=A3LSU8_PICST|nr:Na+/H+ antiporter [Scheffersomyces stipitis CBS 6054]ABN66296.1 Na+/H+ antiporter [Scheffersomyces stipitis CBS 6054]
MVWSQLELEDVHIAYACVGIFSTLFSLVSLFVKERLYIGEATVATIAGLILGPHCLGWFDPVTWGNTDHITLEISRIVLCIQIVAVAVELPRKYMKKHWLSVAIFLLPVMTCGWLVVGLFVWVLIPHFNFSDALLVAACVTATDPVLAAAVVGKGKFAERVPGHLRNLLSAESGCNDGMAFPFIFLSLNIVIHGSNVGVVLKDWILLTILWECIFGCILGAVLGYVLRKLVAFAEQKNLIDRESFLAIFVFLAFNSAGIGSMLGVDDLLVSFAAGTAFGWNGDFAKKTEESHVSTVIDLLLNLAFFVYFGAIVPWPQFNDGSLGLNAWRLVVLAVVVIFLRRLPAVIALKPFTPDVKTWREALFCGHFGPIGVGALFAAILARKDLEAHYTHEETPLAHLPDKSHPHYQLLATIWPLICFIVITSIVVHGSSVAVLTLGKRLNRMAITMSFTITDNQDQGPAWMSRLQKLDKVSTSFSLHRVDTLAPSPSTAVETSGIKVRPAGGAKRRKNKKSDLQRPQTEVLQLGRTPSRVPQSTQDTPTKENEKLPFNPNEKQSGKSQYGERLPTEEEKTLSVPTTAYAEGNQLIIEDQRGEIVESLSLNKVKSNASSRLDDNLSIHSMDSLRRHLSQYDSADVSSDGDQSEESPISKKLSRTISGYKKRTYYRKNDPNHRKVYAHQIDDVIVIENEDGEIIRRYKVNRHPHSISPTQSRKRTGSVVAASLQFFGLKGKEPENLPAVPVIKIDDGKASENKLIVQKDEPGIDSALSGARAQVKLESKLADMLAKSKVSEASEDSEEEDSDDLQETAVEKRRRLEALGKLPTTHRDHDDEEE